MKIQTCAVPVARELSYRQVTVQDAETLGGLTECSYRGTIDQEEETHEQCIEEMRGTLTGKYGPFLDFASFVITEGGNAVSASLITFWKERPLLAFSMSDPSVQGKGYAGFLIERSISALFEKGYPELYLVVTQGNAPAEHLYRRLGFSLIGPALPKQPAPPSS